MESNKIYFSRNVMVKVVRQSKSKSANKGASTSKV